MFDLTVLHFPLSNPVHIFALISLILLLAPLILSRLRLPGTVGLILAGMVVGPHGLHILDKDASVVLLGTVGILYIMFLSGLEVDFQEFKRSSRKSLIFGTLTFAIPQGLGTLVGFYIIGLPLTSAILLASMFASHTLLAYPIASKLGITRDEAVMVAIGGTLVTNTVSLSILAIITSSTNGTLNASFGIILIVSFVIFCLLMFIVLPRLARWSFCNMESEGVSQFVFVLVLVFVSATIAQLAGIEPVIGAFIAGLAVSRFVPIGSTLLNRINFVGNALFIPYFLIYVGMLVNFRVLLGGSQALIVAALMTGTATLSKWIAALITQRLFNYSKNQRGIIFGLTNAQAANTLAAVMVGYRLGLFDDNVLNGTIVMIFFTCIISALVVERAGMRLAESLTADFEAAPAADQELNRQRILVPVSNTASVPRLLDFAFAIKLNQAFDPVYFLTVVTDTSDAKKRVLEAERVLLSVCDHASAGEGYVKPVSRIDVSAAGGIIRVIREMNISSVVLGWAERSSTKEYLFGSLHAQVLAQSHVMTLVNGLRVPLNTIKRLVVVLSPHIEHECGLPESLAMIAALRGKIKVPVVCLGLASAVNALHRYYQESGSSDEPSMIEFQTWREMPTECIRVMEPFDLTIFMLARDGCVAWNADIEPFARKTRQNHADSNIVMLYVPMKRPMLTDNNPKASYQ